MKTELYVIYDKVAMESGPVFEAKNQGVAQRNFVRFMAKTDSGEDFRLLRLGTIDHDTQLVELEDVPVEVPVIVRKATEDVE